MRISEIVKRTNEKLAGETLLYSQLQVYFDEVIDDINTKLNSKFPAFSEVFSANDLQQDLEYNYFPDKYIRTVVIIGAAYKFYCTDEEGIATAQQYAYDYNTNLFIMERDYSNLVPDEYKADSQGYLQGNLLNFSLKDFLNGGLSTGKKIPLGDGQFLYVGTEPVFVAIQGFQGGKGDKGDPGVKGDTGPVGIGFDGVITLIGESSALDCVTHPGAYLILNEGASSNAAYTYSSKDVLYVAERVSTEDGTKTLVQTKVSAESGIVVRTTARLQAIPETPVWEPWNLVFDTSYIESLVGKTMSSYIESLVGKTTSSGGEIFNDYENNQAISDKTTASGTNSIAGCKGFYWYDIDFSAEQPVITLTENRLSPPSSEINTGYAVGDVISIVNDAKYIDCATITAIGDNTITVDSLPFTEVVDMSSDLNFDDYTLCVLEKPTLGQVDLGICANASGKGNKALGAYSDVKGKDNTGKGQYSDIGGRANEGGYCAHIGGRENKGGSYDLIGGYKNNSDGGANVIGGVGNLNDGDNNIMGGRDNINHGKSNVIGGAENLIKKGHHFIGMFGKGHISSELYQLFGGRWSKTTANTLFAIGNGTKDTERSNAFEVLENGRVVLGAEPTSDMDAVNKSFLEKIINALNFKNGKGIGSICLPSTKSSKGAYTFTSGYENVNDEQNAIVGGRNNENYGKNNIMGGAENTFQKGHHFGAMFGRGHISTALCQLFSGSWSSPKADTLLAVGNGTSDENRSNALEVHKDGRATLGAAPINDMDAVNKKYVDDLKKYVDELHNDSANTLKGSASGEFIHIDDIAPSVYSVDFNVNLDNVTETVENKTLYVSGKNLLNLSDTNGDVQGAYRGWLVNPTKQKITMSLIDKDTSVDISGIYLGICDNGSEPTGGVAWVIEKGEIKRTSHTIDRKYISIYKPSTLSYEEAIEKLTQRFYIQVELGTVATEYEDYKGTKYELSQDELSIAFPASSEMNVYSNVPGALIECEYNQDTNAVIEKLINAIIYLGGSV